ncbi:cytochrome c biogenesis protein CcsA [Telluribacter sp. SYSU D00476]|uniref:cytochrome c biogenesis protein CcsA n=1 Tax=Telluribacter sp. SYSU D00476 TaxID=2811430 RepID=UPI001FF30C25|nr:cytochrome c biogenesis protein CcsA [Telluribacter sp. SYSU D00476]
MKKNWWKILTVVLLFYVLVMGMVGRVPRQPILNETVRNLYFHVTMWFGMVIFLFTSLVYAIRYLRSNNITDDDKSAEFAKTGILFGLIGYVTGALWGSATWGDPLPKDPKIISAAIAMLAYFAYLVLRGAFEDEQKRARISSTYNIFAFVIFNVLIWILPRLTDSLHPGNGGNPGFKIYDSDNVMKPVFYPAIMGWTLLGVWITTLRVRIKNLDRKLSEV